MIEIYYGLPDNNINVTEICLTKLNNNNIITIPSSDHKRASYFTDPNRGKVKSIFIKKDNVTTMYDDTLTIKIALLTNTITTHRYITNINHIHSKLKILHGSLNEELPEQLMAVNYLTGNEKVLEIGGNIGRNSLVISYILNNNNNNNNLVTLESHPDIVKLLIQNKELNNLDFYIEGSALSINKLIQRGWDTKPSNVLLDGYNWVNTITFEQLQTKYNIIFDTLVLDCEGAFYYILMDMPEILNNINLIIMENDYWDISHKQYIDNILTQNNFYREYYESGGWGPCSNNFFEVWKK